jgi:hypothetical protein
MQIWGLFLNWQNAGGKKIKKKSGTPNTWCAPITPVNLTFYKQLETSGKQLAP